MNIRGERILIFGDSLSHVGLDASPSIVDITSSVTSSPGGILARDLLMNGAQAVRVNAKVGRSAKSFWGTEGGASLIARDQVEFRPTTVIVWLGTNDIDRGLTPDALASTAAAMAQIRDAYRSTGAEVFALGPPSYPSTRYNSAAPAMLETIRSVFGADHTLDIRALTTDAERASDGVHFTAAGAKLVGPRIAQALIAQPSKAIIATAGMSTGTKVALGALGVVGFVGASMLALYIAKRAARNPRALALALGRQALMLALMRR
jgi:lysophospholipase L1-like esterase